MPLSFLAFAVGFVAFVGYLEAPSRRRLIWWIAATALAGLVKPTTLELGHRAVRAGGPDAARHRDLRIWLGWAIVLAIVAAFMAYARTLYLDYGNTFGILSGGDSKLPATAMLVAPATWTELARYSVVWGVGVAAVPAAIALAWRRRLEPSPSGAGDRRAGPRGPRPSLHVRTRSARTITCRTSCSAAGWWRRGTARATLRAG